MHVRYLPRGVRLDFETFPPLIGSKLGTHSKGVQAFRCNERRTSTLACRLLFRLLQVLCSC
jgi:hypothetical protein